MGNIMDEIVQTQYDNFRITDDPESKVYRYKYLQEVDFTSWQLYKKYFNATDDNLHCFLGGSVPKTNTLNNRPRDIDWRHLDELINNNREHYIKIISERYGLNFTSEQFIKDQLLDCHELSMKTNKPAYKFLNTSSIYMRNLDNLSREDIKKRLFNFLKFKHIHYWNSLYSNSIEFV